MFEPDYSEYSCKELHDCLKTLNRARYPERLHRIEQELELRKEKGELPVDGMVNALVAADVPASVGFFAFLHFLWRGCLAMIILILPVLLLKWLNTTLGWLPASLENLLLLLWLLAGIPSAGTVIMMQVLAKPYGAHTIHIIRRDLSRRKKEEI